MKRVPHALAALAAVALAFSLASCDRRPQIMPAGSDSTGAKPDSFAVLARQAADRWDSGADEDAAVLSAHVVLEALRLRPTAPWPERARVVLDSLGIAAEVAGDERMVVVNLFSRARGDDSSYPYLYWHSSGPRVQALEATDLHLVAVVGRGFTAKFEPSDSAGVAVLWGRRAGPGQQPMLMVWRQAPGGRWDFAQALGPDSLGGTGSGEFTGADTSLALETRTYRPTPYFDECANCPHVFRERRFAWRAGGFERTDEQVVPSPYSSFTGFIAALVAGDREAASRHAVDPSLVDFARRYEWHVPGKGRWRIAPVSDEAATSMIFLRGASEAYRVTFEAREGDFVVAGFEATQRPMD
jgi:hypothetical protein